MTNCLTMRRPARSRETREWQFRACAHSPYQADSVAVLAHAIRSTTATEPHRRKSVRRTSLPCRPQSGEGNGPAFVGIRKLLFQAAGRWRSSRFAPVERHARFETVRSARKFSCSVREVAGGAPTVRTPRCRCFPETGNRAEGPRRSLRHAVKTGWSVPVRAESPPKWLCQYA